jgi:CheY-like chemotaxis protein
MSDEALLKAIRGLRILVVEDDYLIAAELASSLEDSGAQVIGPARSVKDAMTLLQNEMHIDCAVLDIHLGYERVYPMADELASRGVPFVFTTGYDRLAIPQRYIQVPRCEKPVDVSKLLLLLGNYAATGGRVS